MHFALIGADLALKDSGLTPEEVAGDRTGTAVGSGIGGSNVGDQSGIRYDGAPCA